MKILFISILLAGIATGHAQVIQLDEARVKTDAAKVITNGGDSKILIPENYHGEFQKNPIAFIKENFDIHLHMDQLKDLQNESYKVEFKSKKGFLVADFDAKGKLLGTAQRFKNIPLPLTVTRKLATDYKGWGMTKNLYIATGKGDALDKELYRITMKNGKSSKNVKIIPDRPARGLASN